MKAVYENRTGEDKRVTLVFAEDTLYRMNGLTSNTVNRTVTLVVRNKRLVYADAELTKVTSELL